MHLVCEKYKRSSKSTFQNFEAVLNTAIIHGRVPLLCFKMQAHGQIHGRVSGHVATAVHQNYAFFDAATLATKATTLVTMHILNYNIYN